MFLARAARNVDVKGMNEKKCALFTIINGQKTFVALVLKLRQKVCWLGLQALRYFIPMPSVGFCEFWIEHSVNNLQALHIPEREVSTSSIIGNSTMKKLSKWSDAGEVYG